MKRNLKRDQFSDTSQDESAYSGTTLTSPVKIDVIEKLQRHPGSKITQVDSESTIYHLDENELIKPKSKHSTKVIYKYQQPHSRKPHKGHQRYSSHNSPLTKDQIAQLPSCLDSDPHLFPVNRGTVKQDDEPPRLHKKIVKQHTSKRSESVGIKKRRQNSSSKKHTAEKDRSRATKQHSVRKKASYQSSSRSCSPEEESSYIHRSSKKQFPPSTHTSSPEEESSYIHRSSKKQIPTAIHMSPSKRHTPQTPRSAGSLHRRFLKNRYPKRCESAQRSASRHRPLKQLTSSHENSTIDGVVTSEFSCSTKHRHPKKSMSPHAPSKQQYPEPVGLSQHRRHGPGTSHRHSSNQLSSGRFIGESRDTINLYKNDEYDCAESILRGRRSSKTKRKTQIAPVHRKTNKKVPNSQPAENDSQHFFRNEQQVMVLHATERIISYPVPSVHYEDSVNIIHPPQTSERYEIHSSNESASTSPLSPVLIDEYNQSPTRDVSLPPTEESIIRTESRNDFSTIPSSTPRRYESPARLIQLYEALMKQDPSAPNIDLPIKEESPDVLYVSPSPPNEEVPGTYGYDPTRQILSEPSLPNEEVPGTYGYDPTRQILSQPSPPNEEVPGTYYDYDPARQILSQPSPPNEEVPGTYGYDSTRQISKSELALESSVSFMPPTKQSAKPILRHAKCPQKVSEQSAPSISRKKVKKLQPSLFNYKPIWYQTTGNRSEDWFDGGSYYQQLRDTSNQPGAFAPDVNVEQMVKKEKAKRGIPNLTPYSNEDFSSSGKKNKKKKNKKDDMSVSTRGANSKNYAVNFYDPSNSYSWNNAMKTDPKYIKSTHVMSFQKNMHIPFSNIKGTPYSSTLAQKADSTSMFDLTSVYSSIATSIFGIQAYSTTFTYDQPCNCEIENCDCLYACTSRKKVNKSKSREMTTRDRCVNPSEITACSRGRPSSRSKKSRETLSSEYSLSSRGGGRSFVFLKRGMSEGDTLGECFCKNEDCQCVYEPCASRERGKRRVRRKRKKDKKIKAMKRARAKHLHEDRCILCQIEAIERPFSWCMRTCCITWVWSDREFNRHCGRELGPLPEYREKPASLSESWLQRTWNKRYELDEGDGDSMSVSTITTV